jgi:hypothetical protein
VSNKHIRHPVQRDLTELIHHDRKLRRERRENVPEQRRLAASERPGDQNDGRARMHLIRKFETIPEIQNPSDKNMPPDTAIAFREFGLSSFEFV